MSRVGDQHLPKNFNIKNKAATYSSYVAAANPATNLFQDFVQTICSILYIDFTQYIGFIKLLEMFGIIHTFYELIIFPDKFNCSPPQITIWLII